MNSISVRCCTRERRQLLESNFDLSNYYLPRKEQRYVQMMCTKLKDLLCVWTVFLYYKYIEFRLDPKSMDMLSFSLFAGLSGFRMLSASFFRQKLCLYVGVFCVSNQGMKIFWWNSIVWAAKYLTIPSQKSLISYNLLLGGLGKVRKNIG